MKTLMIGMDGVQAETFQRDWTPYISSLIKRGEQLLLKEDLISRGWDEILTGQHAITTGALYDRAVLNGTHEWNTKFKMNDIPGLGTEVKPIWQVLNDQGYRVGIMNVPTTSPAPAVNGFFVSGGGGGTAVLQEVATEQCHPEEIVPVLNDIGYIPDERPPSLFGEKKLYQPKDLFARLEKMVEKRTQAFMKLAKDYEIDFGFIVYKSSCVMAEIFCLPDWARHLKGTKGVNQELLDAIKHFYQFFDEQVRLLVESFSDPEVVLVSDHAMTVTKWHVNINTFLRELGFQKASSKSKSVYKFINYVKLCTPVSIRTKLGKISKVRKAYVGVTPFDTKSSMAFCMVMGDWVPGIFINDRERFGGPVPKSNIHGLSEKIVLAFNSAPASIEHGLSARTKPDIKTASSPYFPDVILDLPDGYLTTNASQPFVKEFNLPEGPQDFTSVVKGPSLCAKARTPLSVTVNNGWKVKTTSEKQDLRLIYDHV
ncbi:MAG: alkaline phosphatase family protein, partial [Desulfosarcina sp.]|nr:alkaline phosphatase family protein [Desulfobacterales bacterium]